MGLINRAILLVFLLLPFLSLSCDTKEKNARGPSPLIHPDKWLVTGRVANTGFTNGEVLALAMDGMRYRAPISSDDSFGIALPGNASYAVHFLSQAQSIAEATSTKMSPKDTPPILSFEESPDVGIRDTLRLPKVLFNRQLDFGEIDIKEKEAYPTINPATRLDFDYDGKNDLSDVDDNGDGLPDEVQRKSSERVEVCHTSEDDRSTTQKIPLSMLYQHTSHGDPLGPCKIAVAPNPNISPKNAPGSGGSGGGGGNANAANGTSATGADNKSKKVANDWRPSNYEPNASLPTTEKKEEKNSETKTDDKKATDSKNGKNGETGAAKSGDSEEADEEGEEEDSDDFYESDDEENEEEDPKRRDRGDDDDDGDVKKPENRFKKPRRSQTSTRGPKKKPVKNDDRSAHGYFFE